MTTNRLGDRAFRMRLLSYVKSGDSLEVEQLGPDVYLVKPKAVVKGYDYAEDWKVQQHLTKVIRKKGFTNTYKMYEVPAPFVYDDQFYACIEYLQPSKDRFHFDKEQDRREGLELLDQFHRVSRSALPSLSGHIPLFDQIRKWSDRLYEFKKRLPAIRSYVSDSILDEWIDWGVWSLEGLREHEYDLYEEKNTIIHGDCAHHNFLRTKKGKLCLIDFDLISEAPPIIDFLQYANRILPSLSYPEEEIWTYPQFRRYKNNKAFLYALTFPTDIFREWNRLIKDGGHKDQRRLHANWKDTVERNPERMAFNRSIASILN